MPEPFVVQPAVGAVATAAPIAAAPAHAAAAGERVPRDRRRGIRPSNRSPRYLDDPEVTDLFVNGAAGLFVDRGGGRERRAASGGRDEEDVRDLAVALIGLGGRHIDDATPCVDVRLEGGIRVHAVLPPVAAEGTAISIRVPRLDQPDLDELRGARACSTPRRGRGSRTPSRGARTSSSPAPPARARRRCWRRCSAARRPHERIVTIEDVAELRIDHPHHVRLEARQANLEGAGAIGLARLVREALRMRPDRLVVGECRGEEVRELLSALNTGHDGGAGTLHANGLARRARRGSRRSGRSPGSTTERWRGRSSSAIGCVLHVERGATASRRLAARRPTRDRTRRAPRDRGARVAAAVVTTASAIAATRCCGSRCCCRPGSRRRARGRYLAEAGDPAAARVSRRRRRDAAARRRSRPPAPRRHRASSAVARRRRGRDDRLARCRGGLARGDDRRRAARREPARPRRRRCATRRRRPTTSGSRSPSRPARRRLMGWLPLVAVAARRRARLRHVRHVLLGSPLGLACLAAGAALIVAAQRWSAALVRRAQRRAAASRASAPSCSRSR